MQGILITPVAGADERLAQLQRRGTPVVLVDSRSPPRGQCSVVGRRRARRRPRRDPSAGGRVTERIAFVGGPMSIRQVADRRDGAVRALERAGGPALTSFR